MYLGWIAPACAPPQNAYMTFGFSPSFIPPPALTDTMLPLLVVAHVIVRSNDVS
jgi:hypothetical protein